MPDVGLMEITGARPEKPSKYTPIATLKWIGGLQTQRSPFMSIDTRYNSRYLGGKPDALIDGSNVEISNKLTLQRRPGLAAYGTASIPSPDFFFSWQQASLAQFVSIVDPTFVTYPSANLQLIVDTDTNGTTAPGNIYNYSPTFAGVILNKSLLSQQTSFSTVINTMYMGNGVDLKKMTGVNLLTQSNNFGSGTTPTAPWSVLDVTLTTGQTDPTGTTAATKAVFSASGSSATAYILQHVTPNYTPVSNNTFTFSIWMKTDTPGATIFLQMTDSLGGILVNTQQTLTTSWALYQVTGTASNGASNVSVLINDPSSTLAGYFLYGAQLEVGGPATPTTITRNKPNGVYLWGIQAPSGAPAFSIAQQTGSTGNPWLPGTLYSQTTAPVTAVAATASLASPVILNGITYNVGAIYTATVTGGAANGLQGRYFSVLNGSGGTLAAANQSVAPGFLCLLSTATTITLYNTGATAQASLSGTVTATLLDSIVDTNGNLEVAYTPGKSGGSQPVWNPVVGQATPDGLQNLVVQSATVQNNATTASVAFPANVTATDTKLVFVALSNSPSSGTPGAPTMTDSSGDTLTLLASKSVSNISIFFYYKLSATAGATTISLTGGGNQASWIGIAEIANQTAVDTHASNSAQMSSSVIFTTGQVTTTNTPDVLTSFALFAVPNGTQGFSLGIIPSLFQSIVSQAPTAQGTGFWNMAAAFEVPSKNGSYNPTWQISNPTTNSNNGYMGITGAFKSSVGTLVWYNVGPKGLTSTSTLGYQYAFSFVNIATGHRSNISPLSPSLTNQAGVAVTVSGSGCQITPSGTGATTGTGDPQVDAIEVYRNTDGGPFYFQIPPSLMSSMSGTITDANGNLYLANPGTATSPGTWSFVDTVTDAQLNTQVYAPIGFLNSPPPAGLTNLEYFDGRLWGSVGNTLYFATGADDASVLNVLQNGVPPESWEPSNALPFNSPIVRSVTTGIGLVVFTTTDVWVVAGSNLATYNPVKVLAGVGLGSYNAMCIDGSTMMIYTRDRQNLMITVGGAGSEIGFVIGDKIEATINPMTAYLARHVKGSQDNAFYLGDGATGWFRLNPNQYGASASGEQTPIWSPFATITNGCKALASIEVQPGVKLLLVGRTGTGTGPVLNRDITVFSDNGTSYTWFATIGSIVLALPSLLAVIESITTEMNNASATQCAVAVLIDEISGTFETLNVTLDNPSSDPPQLPTSKTVLSNRFYLSPGTVPPIGRHLQVKLSGSAVNTKDELLALTVRGEIINEEN